MTGLEIIFEIKASFDVGLDQKLVCKFLIILLLRLASIIIFIVKNDPKLKSVVTLKNSTKIQFLINYEFLFKINLLYIFLFKVPLLIYA
jgi:hypothetical protein